MKILPKIPSLDGVPLLGISLLQIHVDGVTHLLQNTNTHKAIGPDNLPDRFLNKVAREIAPALTVTFKASLNQGTLPCIWKTAAVVPVFKKGSWSDPSNYQPISLTCICVKILEHIVFSHISRHLELHQVLCDEQHGFCPNRSCKTQLITTVNDFAECLNQEGQCDVLFLDFSKAFDKVPHFRSCQKLYHYGIHGTLLSWLQAFLHNQSQYVVVDNQKSQKVESIQRRAARFCFNNFSRHCSITSLLTSLGLSSLQSRRKKAKLLMMYKSINSNLCIPTIYFVPNHPNLRRGYYRQLSTRIDSYKFSFFPSSIKLWNSLPSFVINSTNIDQFCKNLNICAL